MIEQTGETAYDLPHASRLREAASAVYRAEDDLLSALQRHHVELIEKARVTRKTRSEFEAAWDAYIETEKSNVTCP
jgi:hypothetical protein